MKELDSPEPWKTRVLTDSMIFREYGLPYDLRELPQREFQAHKALLEGVCLKKADNEEDKEVERMEKQARKVRRKAKRFR